MDYLHASKFNALKCDEWNYFIKKFKELFLKSRINILKITRKLLLKFGVFNIYMTLIIDNIQLTKHRRWLPIFVCELTLVQIDKVVAPHQKMIFQNKQEFNRPNINVLVEK